MGERLEASQDTSPGDKEEPNAPVRVPAKQDLPVARKRASGATEAVEPPAVSGVRKRTADLKQQTAAKKTTAKLTMAKLTMAKVTTTAAKRAVPVTRAKRRREEQVKVIDDILKNVEGKLRGKDAKATLGDYIKLMQLQKELDQDEMPREIKVTWVDPSVAGLVEERPLDEQDDSARSELSGLEADDRG